MKTKFNPDLVPYIVMKDQPYVLASDYEQLLKLYKVGKKK